MEKIAMENDHDLAETSGIDERAAARYLGTSRKWIQTRRQLGRPPRYYKCGKLVRYRLCDLKAFQDASAVEK